MRVYLYRGIEGEKFHRELSEELCRRAAADFAANTGESADADELRIARSDRGKPYFVNSRLRFSVSHTGSLWACVIAEQPVGFDVQEIRRADWQRLSERFFTEAEAEYVREHGELGFFRLWVRKEAFVKFTGRGFAGGGFDSFSVLDEAGRLASVIDDGTERAETAEIDLGEGLCAAVCAEKLAVLGKPVLLRR